MDTDVLNFNKKLKRKRVLWFCLMVFVMVVIFAFSGQDGESSTEVSSLAEQILSALHIDWLVTPGMVHGIGVSVRKWAHIYVYMALGITSSMWLGTWPIAFWKRGGIAALICCVYSATDEFHQTFVPGRCGTWKDMLYDGSGWAAGILMVLLAAAVYHRIGKADRIHAD